MGNLFDIARFLKAFVQLLPYIKVTVGMVAIFMSLGTVLGILVAVLRINRIPVIYQLLSVYISFMRGTPLLVQLFISYYGLPLLVSAITGIDISNWSKLFFVNVAFILNEGAFLGEIFRGAIESVPAIQTEAAYSIGMTKAQTFFRIVLPQSIKVAIPPYGIDFVGAFQGTSVAFMVGVIDLMGRAKTIGASSGHSLEPYLVVTIIYIVFSILLNFIFARLNKHFSVGLKEVH